MFFTFSMWASTSALLMVSTSSSMVSWSHSAMGSEAFLAAALFGSMGAGDKLKLTPYQSAAEAAQAVAKGETGFAVSHQSQILETFRTAPFPRIVGRD